MQARDFVSQWKAHSESSVLQRIDPAAGVAAAGLAATQACEPVHQVAELQLLAAVPASGLQEGAATPVEHASLCCRPPADAAEGCK